MKTRNTVPIDELTPHPDNVREGDIGAISLSLEAHGQYRPIVVQESSNRIIAGNHTWKAAVALGWTQIAATFIDVDDEQAYRIMLIDNRTNDLATNDDPALAALLVSLAETPAGLSGTGYDGDDLEQLLVDLDQPLELGDSAGDERYTPNWIFEGMDTRFDVDLAAPAGGIPHLPADTFYTKQDDSLTKDWTGQYSWCNPPFSKATDFGRKWLAEIEEGVWLGPASNGKYMLDLMNAAQAVYWQVQIGFHIEGGKTEGISLPVYIVGFGQRGGDAVKRLADFRAGALLIPR